MPLRGILELWNPQKHDLYVLCTPMYISTIHGAAKTLNICRRSWLLNQFVS